MNLWYTESHTENVRFSIRVKEQLFSAQSDFQKIDVYDSFEFGRFFTLDGLVMVTERDEFIYHDMIVHVPMAVNPNIKSVLVIGGGDGGTVRELTRYASIQHIDMVEIDALVVDTCRRFIPQTACKLNDPRVQLHFEDGVKFVQNKENQYDLILVDSTDPIGPGEGLFTPSFYRSCYHALSEQGIMINQHESPYYARDVKAMQRAHKRIKELFPVSYVYQFHMPTYPSGHWLFGFASKGLDPIQQVNFRAWEKLNISTNYYNPQLHVGSFALPTYVQKLLLQA